MELHGRLLASYKLLRPQKNEYILDIGCSGGLFTSVLWKNNFVVGIDLSIENLKIGKKCKEINLLLASATHLPFKENIFHKVAMLELIEHLKNCESRSLSEVNRVLCRDGRVFLSTPNKGIFSIYLFMDPSKYVFQKHRHFSPIEIYDFLRVAHFHDVKISTGGFFAEQIAYVASLLVNYTKLSARKGFGIALKKIAFSGLSVCNLQKEQNKGNNSIFLQRFLRFLWKVADLEFIRGERSLGHKYYSILATARKLGER